MNRITIFLNSPLFRFNGPDSHLPNGVIVVEGTLIEEVTDGIGIATDKMCDSRGNELSTANMNLQIPWSKVDHVWNNTPLP